MASLVNVVLQLVKRLRSYPRHLILSRLAVSLEVVLHIRARHARVKIRELARNPSLITGVPQHAVRADVEAVRHNRRKPSRESLRQPARIDVHATGFCAVESRYTTLTRRSGTSTAVLQTHSLMPRRVRGRSRYQWTPSGQPAAFAASSLSQPGPPLLMSLRALDRTEAG